MNLKNFKKVYDAAKAGNIIDLKDVPHWSEVYAAFDGDDGFDFQDEHSVNWKEKKSNEDEIVFTVPVKSYLYPGDKVYEPQIFNKPAEGFPTKAVLYPGVKYTLTEFTLES